MRTSTPILAAVVLLTSCVLQTAESVTNSLAIYLVDAKLSHRWPTDGIGKPDGLKLIAPPVLADSDFVAFDVTNQTFVITAEATKRLAKSIWDLGKKDAPGWGGAPTILRGGVHELIPTPAPFVLKASGEAIYAGAFYTMVSSSSFAGPVILSDVPFISTNLTSNVAFRIELGYPGSFPGVIDPRKDSRIALAAQKLFAHEKK